MRTASSIQHERLFQINTRAYLLALAAGEINCLSGLTFSESRAGACSRNSLFFPLTGFSLKVFHGAANMFSFSLRKVDSNPRTHTCTEPFPVTWAGETLNRWVLAHWGWTVDLGGENGAKPAAEWLHRVKGNLSHHITGSSGNVPKVFPLGFPANTDSAAVKHS